MIDKSNAAIVSGSGAAMLFGLTPSQWSIVGVIGGLVVGFVGLLVNIYFQHKRLQIAMRAGSMED